jgi:hypothetical protein
VLTRTGAATRDDLDDAKLRAKWAKGREFLSDRLEAFSEEWHVHGTLAILSGRKPDGIARRALSGVAAM